MKRLILILFFLFLVSCHLPSQRTQPQNVVTAQKTGPVRLTGVARNAKLSAAVVTDALIVYCLNYSGWPDKLENRPITVTGNLEYTEEFMSTVTDGAYSAGTQSGVHVIRVCAIE